MSSKTNLTSQKPSTLWRTSYSPPTSEPAPSMPASPWVVKPSKTSVISWQVIQPMSSINIIVTAVRVNFSVKTILNVGLFFLSIPIPGFVPSDRFARTGPVRFSFTDRRNSLRSDTTGRAFGKPNRTLVPAPMVFRHKTLHLSSALQGKEGKFY